MLECCHMWKYSVAYGEPKRKGNKTYKDLADVTWTSLKGWISSTLKQNQNQQTSHCLPNVPFFAYAFYTTAWKSYHLAKVYRK